MNLKLGDILSYHFNPKLIGIVLNYVRSTFNSNVINITMYMLDSKQIEDYSISCKELNVWNKII